MNMKIVYSLTLICIGFLLAKAPAIGQDLHFTNNAVTPTFFNPGQTGNFSGTVRAGLLLRDQWDFGLATPYRTFDLAVDAPLVRGLRKTHWLGAGLVIQNDRTGLGADAATQTWSRYAPSVGYHIGLDKKYKSVLSIGAQYTAANMVLQGSGLMTDFTLRGGTVADDEDLNGIAGMDGINASYGGINVGVVYRTVVSKTATFEIGAASLNLQQPTTSFSEMGTQFTIYRRINFHTVYRAQTSKQLTIEPSAYLTFYGPHSIIQAQMRSEYLLKPKGDLALVAGLGYRVGDALQLLTGARYKDYLIALSYDHSLSEVSQLSPHTIELGVTKIFTINKRPEPKPIIYCPRL